MVIERVSNLAFTKWDELRDAIEELSVHGRYNALVEVHARGNQAYRMHGSMPSNPNTRFPLGDIGYARFLPWHRAYLIVFERELRSIDPALSIPYWDWHKDKEALTGFRDLTGAAIRTVEMMSSAGPWSMSSETILDYNNYLAFARALELNPHNIGHSWIGGLMDTMWSPMDPAFWFLHAQVDRLWAMWQQDHPNEFATGLSDADKLLDPWDNEFSVESVNDITALGYVYK